MKHTQTHYNIYQHTSSFHEARLVYEWNVNAEGLGASAEEAEAELKKEMKDYVRSEMRKLPKDPDDRSYAQDQRLIFLEELKPTDVGLMQLDQKSGFKFGRNEHDGTLILLTKDKARLEKMMQMPPVNKEGAIDNNDGTYTLNTMVGGKKMSFVVDSTTFDALNSYASQHIDDLPEIAAQVIPTNPRQKAAFIDRYKEAALTHPSMLHLKDVNEYNAFSSTEYAKMVDAVVRAHPEAIQYVMTEWAKTNITAYSTLWEKSIAAKPELLQHLTGENIKAVSNYPYLCRIAAEKNPTVIQFVDFTVIRNPNDQKFIVNIAMNAGADVQALLPERLKSVARKLRQNTLLTKEASAAPTEDEKAQVKKSIIEEPNDIVYLKDLIESRPRLIHAISDTGWVSSHENEYKDLWRAAIHEYPAVITLPDTLAVLKQHYKGKKVFDFYTELAKAAATAHEVGQRSEDGSYIPMHVDPEWRKERPDDFRALFIEGGKTKGAYSLLMLLNVDGAEEAFNTIKGVKDPLGYAKALQAAINVDTVLTLLQHSSGRGLEDLQKHLKPLQGSEIKLNSTLQDVLSQNPDLHIYFPSTDKNLLEAKFKNTQSIVLALSSGRNIFMGLDVKDVQAFKSNVFNVLKDPKEQPDNIAALFTQMPKEWKTPADLKELVSANASLYKFVNPDKSIDLSKIDLSIFKAALQAHIDGKGALNWLNDVPKSIRDRMGDTIPEDASIDALVIKEEKPVEHKSAVEDMSDPAIEKLTAQEVFELMRNPNEKPASVLASLLAKGVEKAPIVNDVRFLRDAMDIYSDVYTFVLEDVSAADLRKKPEVEKYIVDKIEQERDEFIALPDALKTQPVYLKAALKKYDAAYILRRSVFKTDKAFADAMDAEFATLSNLDKKIVAYGCTQNHLVAFSDATRAEVLQHNISLALEEMTQEQRAAKVKEMLTQEVSPERDADLKKFVASLDIQHAAKALEDDSGVFDFLSYEQLGSADILEVIAGFTMRTAEMERILDAYFRLDRHEKDNPKKYPNLYARFGERLEAMLNQNEELEMLKVVAERKIVDFELYGDKAIQLESEAERANRNSVGAWKKYALSGDLQKNFFAEDKIDDLRKYVDAMDMKLNVSLLIMSGKLEWTDAELNAIDDKKASLLIGEMNQRIEFIRNKSNPEHHQQNIERIFNRLRTVSLDKVSADLVTALNTVPTRLLPGSLQTKMGALKEKWERAARDNQKENDEALKRARELKEKK